MEGLTILPSSDVKGSEILEGVNPDDVIYVKHGIEVLGIPRGTESGQPTVAIIAHPEGAPAPIVFETTLALLHGAVRGIAAATDFDLETNRVRGT